MTPTDRGATPCHLGGLSVLVTRPAHQADGLCEAIAACHGRPIRFPTLEILGPVDKQLARKELRAARAADLLIFVSANAVQYAFPLLPDELPFDIGVAAVGRATADALEAAGLPATLVPPRMDSEGLLALSGLADMQQQRVVVLRGNGGRELIADTLQARGAEVLQVEVYRRRIPERPSGARNLVDGWDRLVDVVTVTSVAILDNLFALLGDAGAQRVRSTPLVVVSERLADHARDLGCESVHTASSPRDASVLEALCTIAQRVR
jgi:uroporphyrinogen-III synthase